MKRRDRVEETPVHLDTRTDEGGLKDVGLDAKELGGDVQRSLVLDLGEILVGLELDVAQVEDGGDGAEVRVDLGLREFHDLHGVQGVAELLRVVQVRDGGATRVAQVAELLRAVQVPGLLLLRVRASEELRRVISKLVTTPQGVN
jgi:hypothetical protein